METSCQEAQTTSVDRTSSVKWTTWKQAHKVVAVWAPERYFKAAASSEAVPKF